MKLLKEIPKIYNINTIKELSKTSKAIVIANLPNKRYAMPWWALIDDSVSLSDLKILETEVPYEIKNEESKEINEYVTSSKGDKEYTVTKSIGGLWSCTCEGYGFRRRCRHIDEVKKKYL